MKENKDFFLIYNKWSNDEWGFPKINNRHQTTDPRKFRGNQTIYKTKNAHLEIYSNLRKIKDEENILKEAERGRTLVIVKQG